MKKKLLALSVLAAISSQANAFQFDTGDDWAIRWDNTFRANMMSRVAKQDKDVYTPAVQRAGVAWTLADDADLSVDRSGAGLVSARLDVISEMDVIWKDDFGFRISGSGWYDAMYDDDNNDHPGDRRLTWASPSTPTGEYNHEAEDMHYAGGELLDAFVFANFDIGDQALGIRAGRHTIYWGNALATNGAVHGIGGAMAPIDFNKALSVPGVEAKELFMPTGKISSTWQVSDNLTLNAYYGYEYQAYRVPEDGTYWSPAEILSENSEFAILVPGEQLRVGLHGEGYEDDEGDYGFNLQYFIEPWGLETSFIYINYTDKNLHGLAGGIDFGQFAYAQAGAGDPTFAGLIQAWNFVCGVDPSVACPKLPDVNLGAGTMTVGDFKWAMKNDIDLFGISLAKEIAGMSVGVDIVLRQDTGLAPEFGATLQQFTGVPAFATAATGIESFDYDGFDSDNYNGGAIGDTWHVNINGLGLLNGDLGLWDGGRFLVEATFSMLKDCTDNCQYLDARVSEDRVVSQIFGLFQPTWYQVRPGWDMSIPMVVNYTIDGEKSPISFGGDEEGGSASIGVNVDINQLWLISTAYNVRFGPVTAGIGGLLKDRDNISLTVKRTW
jgi:hypothetical protein